MSMYVGVGVGVRMWVGVSFSPCMCIYVSLLLSLSVWDTVLVYVHACASTYIHYFIVFSLPIHLFAVGAFHQYYYYMYRFV